MSKPRTFREAIDQFEEAVRDDAWKGSKHPGDHAEITRRYEETKNALIEYFNTWHERAYRQGESHGLSRAQNSPGNGDVGG